MNIFFSGIGGVALGSLAMIARDAGYSVSGSDVAEGLMTDQLKKASIEVQLGQGRDEIERAHKRRSIDWLVYSAAMPEDHPELVRARELGIRTSKRHELLRHIVDERGLKLIAVSGTHGKTTTTGMLIWAMQQCRVPVSYSIGTTLSFGPSGKLDPNSEYFVYECDEFDRNFLHFFPYVSVITTVGYDHSDTYSTATDYEAAFGQFMSQSLHSISWQRDTGKLSGFDPESTWQLQDTEVLQVALAGEHNRQNATLVMKTLEYLGIQAQNANLEAFPGTNRRFEKLAAYLYSDYAHHPTEIAATIQMAREVSEHVVVVYQPHQNSRQYELRGQYAECFDLADKVYWTPTYLSREDPSLAVLTPEELIEGLPNISKFLIGDLNQELWTAIDLHRVNGDLVLLMGAGSIDSWARKNL